MSTIIIYAFALVGAVASARWATTRAQQIRKDWRSKPTPWLGLPWGPG